MKDLYPALTAEGLKLKRTLALRLAIWCPTVIVLLVFGVYVGRSDKGGSPELLTGFAQLTLTIWTIIVFPLFAALVAALIAAVEHQNDTWKHLLALPVDRSTIFVSKWIAGISLLLFSSLVLATGVVVTAEALQLIKPGWGSSLRPSAMIFRGVFLSSCAAWLVYSIQMWISLRWRSFLPGLVVAVMGLALMFVAIPRGVALFGSLFPWSLPAMTMSPHNPYHAIALGLGLCGGVLVGAVAWHLSRREFC